MNKAFFIAGTDTGAGKTFATCALLHAFAARGHRAVAMKPVAAGCAWRDGRLVCDDAEKLAAASSVAAPQDLINPYAFEPPIAPHIAAKQVGVDIDLGLIVERFRRLASMADVVLVEGVGGFRVPLNPREDTADLAVALGLPVILVVGMKLGCLNHALLTLEAIQSRRLPLAGWVACQPRPAMAAWDENLAALNGRIPAPLLGAFRYKRRTPLLHHPETLSIDPIIDSDQLY